MDNEACYRDLLRCRDMRAPQAVAAFDFLSKKEGMLGLQDEIARVQDELVSRQRPFLSHPSIEQWQLQFSPDQYGLRQRFSILALVGGSQQGKTSKGMSIFGMSKTLKVSCKGCPRGVLPGLSKFDRKRHVAIVFDECRLDQILDNREFFQASVYPQHLSQSLCNQYSYELWIYQTALIVCCNHLPMTEAEGLDPSDADWLSSNVIRVTLREGQTWYLK